MPCIIKGLVLGEGIEIQAQALEPIFSARLARKPQRGLKKIALGFRV